jgi:ABC-2 type transport system ATP-binding protein
MTAVEVKNLAKKFEHVTAVDNVNLEIHKNEIAGFIGPDGAGKTTLLRLLIGLLHPTSGSISLEGIPVSKNPRGIKKFIGYMPQHFSLYGDLSVSENLKFFSDLYSVPRKEFKSRKKELLEFSGLSPFEKRLARNLSGGMQKKLALACNLLHTPKILLLDEPTTGVDPVSRQELWNLLFKLNKSGVTLVITTPYMDEAQRCHKVGLIYSGQLLCYRPPQDLIIEMEDEIIEIILNDKSNKKNLAALPGLKNIYPFGEAFHLIFEPGSKGLKITQELIQKLGITAVSIREIQPSFEDAFINLISEQNG